MPSLTARTFLEAVHIFAGLSEEVISDLSASCVEVRADAGELVVVEDVMGRELFLIGEGRVRIVSGYSTSDAIELAELGAGEFFGEMSLIECRRRAASAVALDATRLFSLSNGDIHRLFKRHPDQFAILILNISRDLSRRLRSMNARYAGLRNSLGYEDHALPDPGLIAG